MDRKVGHIQRELFISFVARHLSFSVPVPNATHPTLMSWSSLSHSPKRKARERENSWVRLRPEPGHRTGSTALWRQHYDTFSGFPFRWGIIKTEGATKKIYNEDLSGWRIRRRWRWPDGWMDGWFSEISLLSSAYRNECTGMVGQLKAERSSGPEGEGVRRKCSEPFWKESMEMSDVGHECCLVAADVVGGCICQVQARW